MQHIIEFVKIKQQIKFLNYRLYKLNQKEKQSFSSQLQTAARIKSKTSLNEGSIDSGSSFSDDKFLLIQDKQFQDICIQSYTELSNKKKKQKTNVKSQSICNMNGQSKSVRSLSLLQKAKNISSHEYEIQKFDCGKYQNRNTAVNLV